MDFMNLFGFRDAAKARKKAMRAMEQAAKVLKLGLGEDGLRACAEEPFLIGFISSSVNMCCQMEANGKFSPTKKMAILNETSLAVFGIPNAFKAVSWHTKRMDPDFVRGMDAGILTIASAFAMPVMGCEPKIEEARKLAEAMADRMPDEFSEDVRMWSALMQIVVVDELKRIRNKKAAIAAMASAEKPSDPTPSEVKPSEEPPSAPKPRDAKASARKLSGFSMTAQVDPVVRKSWRKLDNDGTS